MVPNLTAQEEPRDELSLAAMFGELEGLVATDPVGAIALAREVVALADDGASTGMRLHARRMLMIAYAYTNQFHESLAVRDEAERIPGAQNEPIEISRIGLASMQALASLDRIGEAIGVGQSALETLEAHDAGMPARIAALNIGATFAMTGRQDEALPYFDRAGADLNDNPMLLGQIETNRGTALAALDRFEEAETAFERAAQLLNTDEMSWAAAIAEGSLADLAARQGAINRSLRHFELSRRHLERDQAYGDLGRVNAEQAAVLASAGLAAEARAAFVDAIDLLREHGMAVDLARAQVAYATVLMDAGALADASARLHDTGALINADENPEIHQQAVALEARLELAQGHQSKAKALIDIGLHGVSDRPVQRLSWLVMRANLFRLGNQFHEARATLHHALESAEQVRVTPIIADIHHLLFEIELAVGGQEAADVHARKAIDAYESIRGAIQAGRLRQSYHHGRLDIYGAFYLSLVTRTDEASQREAFRVAERIRSRSLLDAMHLTVSDTDVMGDATADERPLVDALTDHRRWLNWMYSAIADGHEPGEEQQRELSYHEREASVLADRLALLRPQPGVDAPLALEHVQSRIAHGTVILSYLIVDDQLTLQVVSSHEARSVTEFPPLTEIIELIANLQFQVGRVLLRGGEPMSTRRRDRLRRDTDAILSQLHEVLIAPAESLLSGASRVIIVPSGELHSVPFAALWDGERYLVDRVSIVTSPGVSVLARMESRQSSDSMRALRPCIVGVPDAYAPGLAEEAAQVSTRFPTARSLIGKDATREAVLNAMAGSDLIHLACHGRYDPSHPNASGLQLADGWLTLDRLRDIRVDQALVMLTGCETGRVRVEDGDDLVGMMAAMIGAGAQGLVSSLWKTHDLAATALIESFYDALERGEDAVTALAASQRAVRDRFPHPAWWAPFVATQFSRKGTTT